MSVCPLEYLKTTNVHFTQFSAHATCGRGSVLLLRQCDRLCNPIPVLRTTSRFYKMQGIGQNLRRRVCFVQFVMAAPGRSLPSQTAFRLAWYKTYHCIFLHDSSMKRQKSGNRRYPLPPGFLVGFSGRGWGGRSGPVDLLASYASDPTITTFAITLHLYVCHTVFLEVFISCIRRWLRHFYRATLC